jgi:two-component system phosphate regulon response regulator OmpR
VVTANDAADARDKMKSLAFDLLVLDIMMPGESGLELTSSLRAESDVPILLLTARTETEDRIAGLQTGADDYLTKPFEPKELVLRIQSILKRVRPAERAAPQRRVIKFGEFLFELDRRRLFRGEEPVYLTEAETDLLTELATRAGEVVSRDELTSSAGDSDEAAAAESSGSRQVDVQVTRLRRKIENDPRFPRYLQTVRGRGYLLQPD